MLLGTLPAMNRNDIHGFTLPELLLVMVIAGILSVGALQGWQRWQQYQQLRDSVLQLQGFLLRLRAHANWHNRDLTLWVQSGENGCLGAGPKPAEGCALPSRWLFKPPHDSVRLVGINGDVGLDENSNGRWEGMGHSESDYYGYRLRSGQLEMQRGVDECNSSGWEKLSDPAFLTIDAFKLERQGSRLVLQLAGHANSQSVELASWIEGINL